MKRLQEVLTVRKGRYRAFFNGEDLGKPASPPEIRAKYDAVNATVHDENNFSIQLEGEPEIYARITLKLYDVSKALRMLSEMPQQPGELQLKNGYLQTAEVLNFPVSRLLPEWEFEPSFTGDHLITVRFFARADETGKLFYFFS